MLNVILTVISAAGILHRTDFWQKNKLSCVGRQDDNRWVYQGTFWFRTFGFCLLVGFAHPIWKALYWMFIKSKKCCIFQTLDPPGYKQVENAYALLNLGDSVTTDHISPAGSIARTSPAARYLASKGLVSYKVTIQREGIVNLATSCI